MTTRLNKAGRQEAPARGYPRPGTLRKLVRIEGLDPWLCATLVDDLFERRFLWTSDCGRTRFAALGETRTVGFGELNGAVLEAAEDLELPAETAAQLPLGLFVLGETDTRRAAFDSAESETRPHCWTPQALLMRDGDSVLVYCADKALQRELLRRLSLTARAPRPGYGGGSRLDLLETAMDGRETWQRRIEQALASIRRGELEKLVVSRRLVFETEHAAFSPWESTCQAGRAEGRTGFSISMDRGKSMFIGATPETLLKVQDGTMTTHALAGTRERNATLENFLASGKLTKEHTLVSDGLVTRLRPLVRELRPGPLRVRRSGSVSHMETPLTGDLRQGVDPLQIVSDLHPTAAIGGLPQRAAQQALRQLEPYSRGWFAAPFGWLAGNGNLHAAIAIRSLWVSAERAVALAGAGIVAGSVAEEEWAETEKKFDNMRAVIRGKPFGQ